MHISLFLGYIWWSTFFSLAPTIWFFPLNLLEISGYEAFALLLLSPILTLIPFVDRFVCSKYGIILMQILTVSSTLCYHAPSSVSRLLVTSFGCFFGMLWLCGIWWFKSNSYRYVFCILAENPNLLTNVIIMAMTSDIVEQIIRNAKIVLILCRW